MQDETQMTSAATGPDPLAVEGPNDGDIDPSTLLPTAVDDLGAWRNNQRDLFQIFWEFVFPFDSVSVGAPG
jgi:hypothetical protein